MSRYNDRTRSFFAEKEEGGNEGKKGRGALWRATRTCRIATEEGRAEASKKKTIKCSKTCSGHNVSTNFVAGVPAPCRSIRLTRRSSKSVSTNDAVQRTKAAKVMYFPSTEKVRAETACAILLPRRPFLLSPGLTIDTNKGRTNPLLKKQVWFQA